MNRQKEHSRAGAGTGEGTERPEPAGQLGQPLLCHTGPGAVGRGLQPGAQHAAAPRVPPPWTGSSPQLPPVPWPPGPSLLKDSPGEVRGAAGEGQDPAGEGWSSRVGKLATPSCCGNVAGAVHTLTALACGQQDTWNPLCQGQGQGRQPQCSKGGTALSSITGLTPGPVGRQD